MVEWVANASRVRSVASDVKGGLVLGPSLCLTLIVSLGGCAGQPTLSAQEAHVRAREAIALGYEDQGNRAFSDALERYEDALAAAAQADDPSLTAEIHVRTGDTHRLRQTYDQALESYRQALDEGRGYIGRREEGRILNSIGGVYQTLAQFETARQYLGQALEIRRGIKDRCGEARTLTNLALTYSAQGRYPKALDRYQSAYEILRTDSGCPASDKGAVETYIGSLHGQLGQYAKALAYHHKALATFEQAGDRPGMATAYHNIGFSRHGQKDYTGAITAYAGARGIRASQGDRKGLAETLNNLGIAYVDAGKPQEAVAPLTRAVAIARDLGTRVQIAASLDSLGSAYDLLGDREAALAAFQESLVISRQIGDRDAERVTLGNMGDLFERQGRNELAILYYKRAVNVTEAIRAEIVALPMGVRRAYVGRVQDFYRSLADLLLRQDRVLEAQRVLDLLKLQEVADYLGPVRGTPDTANGVSWSYPEQRPLERIEAMEEAALLNELELATLLLIAKDKRDDVQKQRIVELDAAKRKLQREFVRFLEGPDIAAWHDRQGRMGRRLRPDPDLLLGLRDNLKGIGNAALLYPFVLADRLELVLVTENGPPIHRTVPIGRTELNRSIQALRAALVGRSPGVEQWAHTLFRWVVGPIESALTRAGVKTILYVPDAALRYIPLAALHDGRRWLVERFNIDTITSASLTELTTRAQPRPRILAAAFTQGNYHFVVGGQGFDFSGLAFAGPEVDGLARLFPDTTRLLDAEFSPAAIRTELAGHNIVHLATHAALVVGNPSESFIVFGNGAHVTLDEVKYEWSLDDVDLVVLSACETALGGELNSGEEILGFGHLMERRGARATIASLWPVHDGGTQALMSVFYAVLREPGRTKADALREAQVALIHGRSLSAGPEARGSLLVPISLRQAVPENLIGGLSHPYYWAPFILIGNGL